MSTFRQLFEVVENSCKPYIGKVDINAYRDLSSSVRTALEQAGITLPPEIKFEKYGCQIIADITGLGQRVLLDCHIEFKRDGRSRMPEAVTHRVLGITVTSEIREEFYDYELGDIIEMVRCSFTKAAHERILERIKDLKEQLDNSQRDAARLEQELKDSKWDKDIFAPVR